MSPGRILPATALAAALLWGAPAQALELFKISDRTLRLDITAATVAAWNLDNRNSLDYDDDYGDLLNRINVQLSWWRLVGAVRLDTAAYVGEPDPAELALAKAQNPNDPDEINRLQNQYWQLLRSRHRDHLWLGKAFLTYSSPELEVTAGDTYVSFGRGLVLSLRKQDELALDNTLLGGKVVARWGSHLAGTLVAGVANPVRVDEATGEGLFDMDPSAADVAAGRTSVPVFQADRLFGARVEGSLWGATLSFHGSWMLRPETLAATTGFLGADSIQTGGASLSVPFPKGAGSVYLEGVYQHFSGKGAEGSEGYQDDGFAFYGSVSGGSGPFDAVLELQHYRNFHALRATVDPANAESFQYLQYSAPPTTEPAVTDTRYNYFDRCVTGGRTRVNARVGAPVTAFGALGYWQTWGERNSRCLDAAPGQRQRNDVTDGAVGLQISFDDHRSHVIASAGLRHDQDGEDAELFYQELHAELTVAKVLVGAWSVEVEGRERWRQNRLENEGEPWNEGEVYASVKWSPWLVASLGFEYTGLTGLPSTYFNGGVLVKYTSDSNVRLFAGQQRGALKCVSGVCRQFPPFEGVRLEWTQRY